MWECPDFLDLPERPAKPRRHGPTGDFIVLAEVGAKTGDVPVVAEQWLAEMDGDLAAGARWVIAEGRESGTVGLYHANGSVREDLVDVLASRLGLEQVIFEGWPDTRRSARRERRRGAVGGWWAPGGRSPGNGGGKRELPDGSMWLALTETHAQSGSADDTARSNATCAAARLSATRRGVS